MAAPAALAETAPAQLAQADTATFAFAIPVKPLAQALDDFGRITGLSVVYTRSEPAGLSASAVSGRMTADQALRQLLAGSGLTYRFADAKTVTLEKVAADGAMTLEPVTVEGAAMVQAVESAYGPVRGYVAKRSATATKSDASILETPQSISVVGAEEMETRNVQSLEDAVKYTPGIHLTSGSTGDARMGWFNIRGFSTQAYSIDGLSNYSNAVSWVRTDPYLMERVEILRGPASVMYGQTVPGGIINMVSKRPQEKQAAEAAVEYGSFDWKRAEGDITGPLDKDKRWLYRVVAAVQDSDGLNGIEHDKNNLKLFAPSLAFKPREGTALTLLAMHSESESRDWQPRMRYRTAAGETESVYMGEPGYDKFTLKQTQLTAIAEHDVSDRLKLTTTARYSNLDLDTRTIWWDSTALPVAADGVTKPRNNWASQTNADRVFGLDSHAEGKLSLLSMDHTLTGGVDYSYLRYDSRSAWAASTPVNLFSPAYGTYTTAPLTDRGITESRRLGVYAQDQIKVDDRWFFLLGGRQDMNGSAHQDAFTGRLGVAYKTDFGLVPYGSYAESFEPQSGQDRLGKAFDPTTGRQYEIGVKYEPSGVNAMATLALFDLRKQNVLTSDPVNTTYSIQTGEIASRGMEASLTMALAEGLNAVAGYTYNPIEVTKSNRAGEVGRQQSAQPIHLASLWLDYGIKDGPWAGFGFGGGLRFIGKTTNTGDNISSSPQVLDEQMIRYDVEDWRLSMNVKNVLNREVEYGCARQTYAEACYLQEPLTVTARVARKF